ncbi:MAG TPA: sensor histidine kinase [Gemmataceae bacterium]|nr:sensor histidine kinase [Gemmataceae bacterium]
MRDSPSTGVGQSNIHHLLAYVADLELEVDRLRKQSQFIQHETRAMLKEVPPPGARLPAGEEAQRALAQIAQAAGQLAGALDALREPPGYHPAHDQVIAIAIRPLVEQVFRWQRRLAGEPQVALQLDLESEYLEWFPARLRHVLDNLIANALRCLDPDKGEMWVRVGLCTRPPGYELRISDNGVHIDSGNRADIFELLSRAAPVRAAGLGVGLAVVKLLVEESGGTLTVEPGGDADTASVVVLPRYGVDDYL